VSVSDPHIRSLYARLEEVLGVEHADTLMSHLPDRADELATKSDIATVRSDLASLATRFERLEDRFDRIQEMMHTQLKTYSVISLSAMTALTAIYGGMLLAFG